MLSLQSNLATFVWSTLNTINAKHMQLTILVIWTWSRYCQYITVSVCSYAVMRYNCRMYAVTWNTWTQYLTNVHNDIILIYIMYTLFFCRQWLCVPLQERHITYVRLSLSLCESSLHVTHGLNIWQTCIILLSQNTLSIHNLMTNSKMTCEMN